MYYMQRYRGISKTFCRCSRSSWSAGTQSSSSCHLVVPLSKLCMADHQTFQASGLWIWNDLPEDIVSVPSLPIFRRRLKAQLFQKSYPYNQGFLVCSSTQLILFKRVEICLKSFQRSHAGSEKNRNRATTPNLW